MRISSISVNPFILPKIRGEGGDLRIRGLQLLSLVAWEPQGKRLEAQGYP